MDIEQSFAAAVLNARGESKMANTAGYQVLPSDQVAAALADLWEAGRREGLSSADIQAIADRYVEYDDGDALPRPPTHNVTPFRR